MKMTVSQAMVECLKAENVKVVFGYPGAAICPFYDALLDAENDIRQVLVRQEANGGHAANGYERISGKPAVRSEERRVGKECRSRWSPYH